MKIIPSLIACGLMAAPLYAQNAPAPLVGATTQTAQAQSALELLHPELALIPKAGVDSVLCLNRMRIWEELFEEAIGDISAEELQEFIEKWTNEEDDTPRSMSFAGDSASLEKFVIFASFFNLLMADEEFFHFSDPALSFESLCEIIFKKNSPTLGEEKIAPFYFAMNSSMSSQFMQEFTEDIQNMAEQNNESNALLHHQGFTGTRLSYLMSAEFLSEILEVDDAPKTIEFMRELLRRDLVIMSKVQGENVLIVIAEDINDIPATPASESESLLASPLLAPLHESAQHENFIAGAQMPASLLRRLPFIGMLMPQGLSELLLVAPHLFEEITPEQVQGLSKLSALMSGLAATVEQGNASFSAHIGGDAALDIKLSMPCQQSPFLVGAKPSSPVAVEGEVLRLNMSPRSTGLGIAATDLPALMSLSQVLLPNQKKDAFERLLAAAFAQGLLIFNQPERTSLSLHYTGDFMQNPSSLSQETWQGLQLDVYPTGLLQLAEEDWKRISTSVSDEAKKEWNGRNIPGQHLELEQEEASPAPEAAPEPVTAPLASRDPDEGEDYEEEDMQGGVIIGGTMGGSEISTAVFMEFMRLNSSYANYREMQDLAEVLQSIRFTLRPENGQHKMRLQFIKNPNANPRSESLEITP